MTNIMDAINKNVEGMVLSRMKDAIDRINISSSYEEKLKEAMELERGIKLLVDLYISVLDLERIMSERTKDPE